MTTLDTAPSPGEESVDAPPVVEKPAKEKARKSKGKKEGDYRRAYRVIMSHRGSNKPYLAVIALLAFEALMSSIEAFPIKWIIDFLQGVASSSDDVVETTARDVGFPAWLSSPNWETVILLGVGIIIIAALSKAADSMAEVFLALGGRSLGNNLRIGMYDRLQKLSMTFHDKRRTGDVLTRVTGDVTVVEEFVTDSLSDIAASFMLLFFSFAVLLTQDVRVAVIAIVMAPLLGVVSNYFSRRLKKFSKKQRSKEGDLASTAQEMLSSIRLVQSYGRGHVDLERFSEQSDGSMKASLRIAVIQAQFSWVIAILEGLTIALVVWLGYWLFTEDQISAGTLIFFVLTIQNMFKPSRKIVQEWYKLGKLVASTDRIDELLAREPAVVDGPLAKPAPVLTGNLAFDHVDFSYHSETEQGLTETKDVLHDITFAAEPGEVVAIVGPSGAGKSSIAQLVPRLYDPDAGSVSIDGIDLRDMTLSSLRSQVSLVLQETVLLTGTVAENIAYGIDDPDREQVVHAARLANAHEFIEELPDGYDTVLGERGSTFSGGQRQRIAIARAFIRQAPVIILDEPTTGLDPDSGKLVIEALKTLIEGTTTVIVSHDIELIKSADRVLVLTDGRIVQQGTPEQLAAADGPYAELFGKEGVAEEGDIETLVATPSQFRLKERLPVAAWALDDRFAMNLAQQWVAEHVPGRFPVGAETHTAMYGGHGDLTLRVDVSLDGSHPSDQPLTLLARANTQDQFVSVKAFPHDPGLPTLAAMLDRKHVGEVLVRTLPGMGGSRSMVRANVTVVHHPRVGAAVLRYDLLPGAGGYGELRHAQVFAKVYPTREETLDVAARLRAVGTHQLRVDDGPLVRTPRLLGVDADLHTVFLESLSVDPHSDVEGIHAPVTIGEAAQVLRTLHSTSPKGQLPTVYPIDELRRLETELELVGAAWPDVADRVEALVVPARRHLEQAVVGPLVLSHGDYTPSQLIRQPDGIALLDLDSLSMAEAAFDVGRFIAYHDIAAARHHDGTARARETMSQIKFLAAYAQSVTDQDVDFRQRVRSYRSVSLARLALRATRRLKNKRLDLALRLLETDATNKGSYR